MCHVSIDNLLLAGGMGYSKAVLMTSSPVDTASVSSALKCVPNSMNAVLRSMNDMLRYAAAVSSATGNTCNG